MRVSKLVLSGAFFVFVNLANAQLTTKFTYQGRLNNSNSPFTGNVDLSFTLWDSLSGGAQIGAADVHNGVAVTSGLFTVEVNDAGEFGATAFDGNGRWLQIAVNGTPLTPRQPLNAAPYSSFALVSPGSGLWTGSASAIMNTNGSFVGVNRTAKVSGAEYFGIQAPVSGASYGGMYIRTDSATGLPFYGYRAGPSGNSAWSYLDGASGDWRLNVAGADRMVVDSSGEVGIGTTSPSGKLHVAANSAGDGLYVTNTGPGRCAQLYVPAGGTATPLYAVTYGPSSTGSFEGHTSNTNPTVYMYKNQGPVLRLVNGFNGGTAATDAPLAIVGGSDTSLGGGGFIVCGSVAGTNLSIDNNEIMARNNGAAAPLYINNEGGDVYIAPQATAHVRVLEITGADLAEKFPINEKIEPGKVVMIDAKHPGQVCLAKGAYNKRVAGIVSGANGLPAGTILGNLPGQKDTVAIALSGRVWVHCDATQKAIEVGDMLTTSQREGYAMAVQDSTKAFGAVIGKAMTSLAKGGSGMVLVLVNLQ